MFCWIVISVFFLLLLCRSTTDLRMTRARFVNSVYISRIFFFRLCQRNAWLRYSFSLWLFPFLCSLLLNWRQCSQTKTVVFAPVFIFVRFVSIFSYMEIFIIYSIMHEPFTNILIFLHFFFVVSWKWMMLSLSWNKKDGDNKKWKNRTKTREWTERVKMSEWWWCTENVRYRNRWKIWWFLTASKPIVFESWCIFLNDIYLRNCMKYKWWACFLFSA